MVAGRRGMSLEGALMLLVLFGAVFLITALLYRSLLTAGKEGFSDKECQASLLLTRVADTALSPACFKVASNPVPLKCSRRFLTVTEDSVTDTSGKPADVTRAYDPACPAGKCLPQRVIAEEMLRCWSVFREGELPVFQQVDRFWDVGNNERACFVCAEVTLRTGAARTGFVQYLRDTTAPGRDEKYFDFLAGNPRALCNPARAGKAATCWESFSEPYSGSAPWISWVTKDLLALDQDTLSPGAYAIVLLREGMEQDCGEHDAGDLPSMTVQAIPVARIAEYCPVILA